MHVVHATDSGNKCSTKGEMLFELHWQFHNLKRIMSFIASIQSYFQSRFFAFDVYLISMDVYQSSVNKFQVCDGKPVYF